MRRHALALTAATAALALAACSGGGGDVEEGTEPPTSFTTPSWSLPFESPQGEWVNSMQNDEVRVDVYFVGLETAPEDSGWADTETDEPTFVAGDDVMLLQWVITNVGEDDVILMNGGGTAHLDFRGNDYASIPPEGFDELLEANGVPTEVLDHTQDFGTSEDRYNLPLAPGESVTEGDVYWYPEGEELLFGFKVDRSLGGVEADYDDPIIDGDIALPIDA